MCVFDNFSNILRASLKLCVCVQDYAVELVSTYYDMCLKVPSSVPTPMPSPAPTVNYERKIQCDVNKQNTCATRTKGDSVSRPSSSSTSPLNRLSLLSVHSPNAQKNWPKALFSNVKKKKKNSLYLAKYKLK